jgi:TetR/AcrR family transcriptional regulator, fatty acid metabolism regulator protein
MKKNAGGPESPASQPQDPPRIDVPPGGVKIMEALKLLLQEKSFDAITTAEISKVAGANEALIYRYFKDKRGLLHKVLAEYTLVHLLQIRSDVKHVHGALNKLRNLMKGTISFHKKNRVFSQILLLDVRNYPGYFDSDAYELVKQYARLIDEIVEEGIKNREIRDDISMACVKDVIVGSIEHACLRSVVFKREFDEELLARNLTETVIGGLARPEAMSRPTEDEQDRKLDDRTGKRRLKTRCKKLA